jgi:hypothetical protein
MISTDFDTRQLLAREHRERLAQDMRLARGTRPDTDPPRRVTRALARIHEQIRSVPRLRPSHSQPQEV